MRYPGVTERHIAHPDVVTVPLVRPDEQRLVVGLGFAFVVRNSKLQPAYSEFFQGHLSAIAIVFPNRAKQNPRTV